MCLTLDLSLFIVNKVHRIGILNIVINYLFDCFWYILVYDASSL